MAIIDTARAAREKGPTPWAMPRDCGAFPPSSRRKQPKLSTRQQREQARMAATGGYAIADLAEVFTICRATVYRIIQRGLAAGTGKAS